MFLKIAAASVKSGSSGLLGRWNNPRRFLWSGVGDEKLERMEEMRYWVEK